jgi:bifunctional UDP-N-acetylglucosamine pyrophosphorylase / glucosamine-1-phosphate N-acetyltransferase
MNERLIGLVLAAGKGTRFKSDTIKILHPLLGKPMVSWVVSAVTGLSPAKILVVVGHQKELVQKHIHSNIIEYAEQKQPLGTAHAVKAAVPRMKGYSGQDILIINGDLPLIQSETLKPMLNQHLEQNNDLTFATADLDDPTGFGRVIYQENNRVTIIEERDATPDQRKMKESNVGIYIFKISALLNVLPRISNQNAKREYYLTDCIQELSRTGNQVRPHKIKSNVEIIGVNDRYELAQAAAVLRDRKLKALTLQGVTIMDPANTWIDQDVEIGADSVIYPGVVIEGATRIGRNVLIQPSTYIRDSEIEEQVKIFTSSVIEESRMEAESQTGPFSHLRPGTVIRKAAKVGNFVEMKNTDFGPGSKAGHLSYLGDSRIGRNVNIGAGTITCNYDGRNKHQTIIEDDAFTGSGTELVAPVKIGKGAYIGAGSTITQDVPPGALALERSRQIEKKDWVRSPKKK